MKSDDLFDREPQKNGTTIQFEIGTLVNARSLKTSGYFYLATYEAVGMKKYLINESKNLITVTNTVSGPIVIAPNGITQTVAELDAETSIRIRFTTQSPIPSNG